ncbi:hypothetical protein KS4_01070 [Poriferisphaera corsica]|uniref:Uncharacterized protein n=1 Tax=Poriferisphaera corsica TaxID=2528020 RepID=A0A517YPC7_9BACT|nr:hypothetical protein KS4_01070 [Poriferisphaera corsica]
MRVNGFAENLYWRAAKCRGGYSLLHVIVLDALCATAIGFGDGKARLMLLVLYVERCDGNTGIWRRTMFTGGCEHGEIIVHEQEKTTGLMGVLG